MTRPSISTDSRAIDELLAQNFHPSLYESRLRDLIANGSSDYYEWVHMDDNMVVGHILYSPAYRNGAKIGYHLAPVSVHPDYRRQGIATKLILNTLGSSVLASESIFVLGDPKFYEPFGFAPTSSVICPFDEGNKHFRALRWEDGSEIFTVEYPKAFLKAGEELSPA